MTHVDQRPTGSAPGGALSRADLPVGTRCWEHDRRNGDACPRGGIVIGHANLPGRGEHVVCASSWGTRARGTKANAEAYIRSEVIPIADINPATIEAIGASERIKLARAVAAVIGTRKKTTRTDDDDRDLGVLRELMLPPAPPDVGGGWPAGVSEPR